LALGLLPALVMDGSEYKYAYTTFTTLAGRASSGSEDGAGGNAGFDYPSGLALDAAGNIYVAERRNSTIRKITPGGVVTTLAGLAVVSGSADGTGSDARFKSPGGVAVDSSGNVYVADSENCTIRKITPAGMVTTLAGSAGTSGSADGSGTAARFQVPEFLTVDNAGNVYVADSQNCTIRKITPAGMVTTLAGLPGSYGSADGTGAAARFDGPQGLAVDAAGNVYVADLWNFTIRKVTPDGVVTTLAGQAGTSGSADGTGGAARFGAPWGGVAVDATGNLYVADYGNDTIRKITPDGVVTTLAGQAGATGSADGTGGTERFDGPVGVALDASGNLYVADSQNNTIRKIAPGGVVTTLAGLPPSLSAGSADGVGPAARFDHPAGVAVDVTGTVYATDTGNSTIRKITPDGTVSTLAGLAGVTGSADGIGSAARFNRPYGVAVDRTGTLFVADSGNSTIRRITPSGGVTTFAGRAGEAGTADGIGDAARFNNPTGVAVDAVGTVYVADYSDGADYQIFGRGSIRKITPLGVVSTLESLPYAQFLGVDAAGALYATTLGFNRTRERIAKMGPTGIWSDVNMSVVPSAAGIAVDAAGNLYVSNLGDQGVSKIIPEGVVLRVAGLVVFSGSSDGPGSAAGFRDPLGVAVDSAGNIYVADCGNNTIRKGQPDATSPPPVVLTPPYSQTVAAGRPAWLFVSTRSGYPVFLQWQRQASGGTWTNLTDDASFSGTGTDFLTVNMPTAAMNGDLFRCVVTDAGGSVTSAAATLVVTGSNLPPIVTTPPASWTATTGLNAVFVVTAYSTIPMTYQWQRVASGSSTWNSLTDSASYSGTTTASLTVNAIAAMNSDSFRCVLTNANGSVVSSVAMLTVAGGTPLTVSTFAGQAGNSGSADGAGSAARFFAPADVAVDGLGNLYLADTDNHTVRKVTPAGLVTTLAGQAGSSGSADGAGSAARFSHPAGVAVDTAGEVFVSDTDNNTVRKITPAGIVSTLAGVPGTRGLTDGSGSAARFNGPSGIVVDTTGSLYVADTLNNAIRQITSSGTVVTVYPPVHIASGPWLSGPQGLVLDRAGNLFVADTNSNAIKKIVLATSTMTTVAGTGVTGADDGAADQARFNFPSGIAADGAGNLLIADTDNHAIRQITAAGVVSTIAGLSGTSGIADGVGATARFNYPTGITVDDTGNLYIADTNNHTIRLAYFAAGPAITAQPQSQTVTVSSNVQFSVLASGKPVPTYQWSFNGVAISGATSSTLSLTNVQLSHAGTYTVTVANASGSATSNAATLAVNPAAPAPSGGGSSGSSGGGAMEAWFATALALIATARGMVCRRS
jgi:sugar lactone lactonase YvrE